MAAASLADDAHEAQRMVPRRLDLAPMAVPSRSISDHHAEFVTMLGLLATTSGKISREIYQLMKTEYQEAEEPVPSGTVGSSTMPHKRNSQLCQDIIGITNEIRALVPLALESALSEHEGDNSPSDLFDIQQHACELTAESRTRVHVVISGLRTNPKRMRRNLDLWAGMISSEAIMLRLGHTLGRHIAHEIVYDAAQSAVTTSASFADILAADPRVTDHLDAQTIKQLLQPDSYLGLAAAIARAQATRARNALISSG